MVKKIKDQSVETGKERTERRMAFHAPEEFTALVKTFAKDCGLRVPHVRDLIDAEVQRFIAGLDVKAIVKRTMFGD